jgi:hypothetical protein
MTMKDFAKPWPGPPPEKVVTAHRPGRKVIR